MIMSLSRGWSLSHFVFLPSVALALLVLSGFLSFSYPVSAQTVHTPIFYYSIDSTSPSLPTLSPSDVYARPARGAGTPLVAYPMSTLGLTAADDIDAMTFPNFPRFQFAALVFTTARGAIGNPPPCPLCLAPNHYQGSLAGQSAGDIYVEAGSVINLLLWNQQDLGLLPNIGFFPPWAGPLDNLDALAMGVTSELPYFSLPSVNNHGVGGADILTSGAAIVIPSASLGLLPGDDIDALFIDSISNDVYFSLAPGSASLPVLGSVGDIFVVRGGFPPITVFQRDWQIQLSPGDDVTGITLANDTDFDTIGDYTDNCSLTPNPSQIDSNFDLCGNACDADYDDDLVVTTLDALILQASMGLALGQPGYNPDVDHDGNNVINQLDQNYFNSVFGTAPGPGYKCNW